MDKKTDSTKKRSFFIKTFGCQMNLHDSEKMATVLVEEGFSPTEEILSADLIVFNTCCVRGNAENRFFGHLQALKRVKEEKPNLRIAVGGCVAQNEGESLLDRFDHIDLVFGTKNFLSIASLLNEVEAGGGSLAKTAMEGSSERFATERQSPSRSWVTISTGCNNFCSYCIVPFVRGREESRPIEDIRLEVERLADEGTLEITLLGQNVNSFGSDIYGKPSFSRLLGEVSKVKGIERIRFTTSHPKDLSHDLIETIASTEKICRHIHLPLQSGSNSILKKMGRGYSRQDYLKIVKNIKDRIEGCNITTDIMVGFPGELEEDFAETLEVVKEARFGNAFTFIYSPRKGTRAFDMEGEIAKDVVDERFGRLLKLQDQIGLELNRELVGSTKLVLVEGASKKDETVLTGHTECNRVVNFKGPKDLINTLAHVKIEIARSWSLAGSFIKVG